MLTLTLVCAAACQNNKFGDAIGRPFPGSLPQTNTAGIEIMSVTPDSDLVTLLISADAMVPGYHLENGTRAQAPLTGESQSVPDGFLGRQSGEVAVVANGTEAVESYFAWGVDPSIVNSPLYLAALQIGVQMAPVAVPFPLSAGAVITRDGCSNCTTAPSPIQLSEVHPANGVPGSSYVELEASGDVDITGVRVCNNGQCQDVPEGPNNVLAAGDLFVLDIAIDIPGDVETVLAAPGTGEPQFLLDYMRTSTASAAFESSAVEAGVWPDTDAATPVSDYVAGESLSRNPGTSTWFPALASENVVNPVIDRAGTWNSCAQPANPAPRPPALTLVASEIDRAGQTVMLENTTATPIDLSPANVQVLVDDVALTTSGTLAAGASVSVPAVIDDTGKIAISVHGASAQFAQWGNAAAGVSTAVAAGLWPATRCLLPRIDAAGALTLRSPTLALGSGAYATSQ